MTEKGGFQLPKSYIRDAEVASRVAYASKAYRDRAWKAGQGIVESPFEGSSPKVVKMQAERSAKWIEDRTEQQIASLKKLKSSPDALLFLEQAAHRAGRLGIQGIGETYVDVKTASEIELYDKYGDVDARREQPPVCVALMDIATVLGDGEKVSEKLQITRGTFLDPIDQTRDSLRDTYGDSPIPEELIPGYETLGIVDALGNITSNTTRQPDLVLVEDLYTVLGFRDETGHIPDLPPVALFTRAGKKRFTMEEFGVDLTFTYTRPEKPSRSNSLGNPGSVELTIKKGELSKNREIVLGETLDDFEDGKDINDSTDEGKSQ